VASSGLALAAHCIASAAAARERSAGFCSRQVSPRAVRESVVKTNHVPKYDPAHNETACCPRFDPKPWENQEFHFEDKPFVRVHTLSLFHVPLNMGSVFTKTFEAIKRAHANDDEFVVLSHDESAWSGEHLFAVKGEVPGVENVKLSGDFLTHVFEGPFSDTPKWCKEMAAFVAGKGKRLETLYFYYTTCPRCAKHYGKNYVVGIAQVA
jgi:hypothetical protein